MNNPAKRRTIRKVLRHYINEWLKSLPETLTKQIKDDIVVTGGSIVSLLTGERINDIDIYFRTIESATTVAQHYANQMDTPIEVHLEEQVNIRGETETRVINYITSRGVAGDNGGADEADEIIGKEPEPEDKPKHRPMFISRNAITLSDNIQLITRFYGEPEQIHKTFDFVHATCWYTYKNDHLELPANALESILSNTLYYQGSLYPIASIFRMKKFISRGWRISAGDMLKIMWQISELDLTNRELLIDQLTGVDQIYMDALVNALTADNLEPEKRNSVYAAEVIDRIFNS